MHIQDAMTIDKLTRRLVLIPLLTFSSECGRDLLRIIVRKVRVSHLRRLHGDLWSPFNRKREIPEDDYSRMSALGERARQHFKDVPRSAPWPESIHSLLRSNNPI